MEGFVLSTDATGSSILWNIETRCQITSFKENVCSTRGAAVVLGSRDDGRTHVDAIIGCQSGRAYINMYSVAKDLPLFKCGVPELMHSVAVTPDGAYCVCGGASGRAYLWELWSGALLRVWSAHYKRVGAVTFSPCGTVLITGGDDGIIQVWAVSSLVDVLEQADLAAPPIPCTTWSDHALAITSLRFGPGVGLSAVLVSTSLDRSARLWDIASGRCIANIPCPSAVHASCIDPMQRRLYLSCIADISGANAALAGSGGSYATSSCVCEIDLHASAARSADPSAMILGAAVTRSVDTLTATGFDYPCFVGHTGTVNELHVSPDGSLLVTAGQDSLVRIFDTTSRSCVHVFEGHKGSPVVSLLFVPRFGNGNSAGASGSVAAPSQSTPMAPLKKHQVPIAVEWKGSSTGPLDATIVVAGRPIEPRGVSGGIGSLSSSAALYASDVAALLALLDSAAAVSMRGPPVTSASDESLAAAEELQELRRRNAQLEDENKRWKVVNNALLEKMKGASNSSSSSEGGNGSAVVHDASSAPSLQGSKRSRLG